MVWELSDLLICDFSTCRVPIHNFLVTLYLHDEIVSAAFVTSGSRSCITIWLRLTAALACTHKRVGVERVDATPRCKAPAR